MAKKKTLKKKAKKNSARLKKNSASKRTLAKKASGKKLVAKKAALKKPAPKKKTAPKKAAAKPKSTAKKTQTAPVKSSPKRQIERSPRVGDEQISSMDSRTRSAGQSGDLQGLSDIDRADSESVDELIEEGNAFEAGIVEGVEEAGDREGEVHTHEVPEDDVPGEYLDEE
jgi:hypothetical protein